MTDETLIRAAIADQADRAVDASMVLRDIHAVRRRRVAPVLAFGVAAAVIAVVSVLVVPRFMRQPENLTPAAPAPMNVLVMGVDGSGNTDAMMLVRLDADARAVGISLPRDSWVDIPGHGMGRLNSAYRLGQASGAVATVSALTGVRVDHHLVIDMDALDPVVSAVGGVNVTLCAPVQDTLSGARFPGGPQTLSGADALAFVRQRHGLPNGDLDRVLRQQVLVKGLLDRLSTPDLAAKAAQALSGHVATDLDLLALAPRLTGLRGLTLSVMPTEGEIKTSGGAAALKVSPDTVRQFVTTPTPITPTCVP